VVFTSYLSNAFPSAPSVVAFHASAWPHRRKEIITDFSNTHFDSLPERLGSLGYETVYVGADPHFDNQDRWLSRWYGGVRDLVASGEQATDKRIVSRAIAEIERHDRESTRPLFAFVSTYSSHYPFRLPADAGETEAPASEGLGRRYRQVLRYTDAQIGTLLDALARRPRRDRTLTIVVGDHAFYTNLRKTSGLPENDNAWTAALIHGPADLIGAPRRIADPASHVDMLPTILALVGDDRPTAAVGSNLLGAARRTPPWALAIRPGGVRFDRGGYSAFVDARVPRAGQIRPAFPAGPRAAAPDLPTAAQLTAWVDDWSYLIEQNRVWNPALLGSTLTRSW
jgi:arylsulfatase A-like enzyme